MKYFLKIGKAIIRIWNIFDKIGDDNHTALIKQKGKSSIAEISNQNQISSAQSINKAL